jgi:hypothetical protein
MVPCSQTEQPEAILVPTHEWAGLEADGHGLPKDLLDGRRVATIGPLRTQAMMPRKGAGQGNLPNPFARSFGGLRTSGKTT